MDSSSSPVFILGLRRRKSPLAGTFFTPSNLTGQKLLKVLRTVTEGTIAVVNSSSSSIPCQKKNIQSLVRKVKLFLSLFEFLNDSCPVNSTAFAAANLCFKELYVLVHRCKLLLDYCNDSSRLWLLLQSSRVSGYFHNLNLEISTILDVFPLNNLGLTADLREQIELLRRQTRESKLYVDQRDEALRLRIWGFLEEFEIGGLPTEDELKTVFVDMLGIRDAEAFRLEIELLEEQIYTQEDDFDMLDGVVALTRYCRFLLLPSGDKEEPSSSCIHRKTGDTQMNGVIIPKEFCCPISLDLMEDPVIVSTGQTYDRSSIARWLEDGRISTCPNTGQKLTDAHLVPNRALRNLISNWCSANGVAGYDVLDSCDSSSSSSSSSSSCESLMNRTMCKAAVQANRATASLLVKHLSAGPEGAKGVAAHELRLLAKTGRENRACIAEAGAIPLLHQLLSSSSPFVQENSVTAILNLSIHESNKSRIMDQEGCLRSIVSVLMQGLTEEARENAAAVLFSLSSVHDYKKQICEEDCAIEALVGLLKDGSLRGKKDAVMALYNLSTHPENCQRMIDSSAVSALAESMKAEGLAEEASGALSLLVRQQIVAEVIAKDNNAVMGLMTLMRRGSPKAKENVLAAFVEMCRSGGASVIEKVASMPTLYSLIHTHLLTGTKRSRRKAASLAKIFQRHAASGSSQFKDLPQQQYAIARRNMTMEGSDFGSSLSAAVSVPAL